MAVRRLEILPTRPSDAPSTREPSLVGESIDPPARFLHPAVNLSSSGVGGHTSLVSHTTTGTPTTTMKVAPIINTLYMGTSPERSAVSHFGMIPRRWHPVLVVEPITRQPFGDFDVAAQLTRTRIWQHANRSRKGRWCAQGGEAELIDTIRNSFMCGAIAAAPSRDWFNSNHNGQTDRPAQTLQAPMIFLGRRADFLGSVSYAPVRLWERHLGLPSGSSRSLRAS